MPRSETQGRVRLGEALAAVEASTERLATLFRHGTLEVEFYAPKGTDPQKPHERDEVYVIARGTGVFRCHGRREPFGPGDFLFAPAGMEHGFEEFSEDFGAWVLFYGPKGGEPA
jgi:mannose-6-phosphate isomerase-like protein (cupin superfamily)